MSKWDAKDVLVTSIRRYAFADKAKTIRHIDKNGRHFVRVIITDDANNKYSYISYGYGNPEASLKPGNTYHMLVNKNGDYLNYKLDLSKYIA